MDELRRFIRGRWQEVLLLGIALQAVMSAIFTFNPVIIAITLALAVLLGLVVVGLSAQMRRRATRTVGESAAFKVPRRGIVFTIGMQTDTVRLALTEQKPEFVGLICTARSETQADAIIEELGLDETHAHKRNIDSGDIREIRAVTAHLIDWLQGQGLKPGEIAVDITGGLTTMSVAVYSMAEDMQIDTQYVRSQYDEDRRPIFGTQEGVFVSRYSKRLNP